MKKKFTPRGIVKYFFQGLLVIAPIAVTAFAIYWIFNTVDSWVPLNIMPAGYRFRGVGFLLILIFIILVGYLSSLFFVGRILDLFDRVLERTPFIKYIYTSVKDLFDAVVGEKRKFDHPVLVNTYADDVWEVGFITQSDMSNFGLEDVMAVYVPQSYAIAGRLYLVKKYKVKPLENISAGDAMKFAVSGGVAGTQDGEVFPVKEK
jgi:uncharacterized membrane protein